MTMLGATPEDTQNQQLQATAQSHTVWQLLFNCFSSLHSAATFSITNSMENTR